jgi:hypothetical protein
MAAGPDEAALRRALEKEREQNRTIAADNRLLREERRLVSSRAARAIEFHNAQKVQMDQAAEQARIEIQNQASERQAQQRQRPRALRVEIRATVAANRVLENEIRVLGGELVRMKRLNESMPIPVTRPARAGRKPKTRKGIRKRQPVLVQ